jgi:outer membrane protein TolC
MRALTALLTLVTCCGCVSSALRPHLERSLALADAVTDAELSVAPVASASLSGPVSIRALLDLARRRNAGLKRAAFQALAARAQANEAFAQVALPRLSFQAAYFNRSNTPATRSNFGGMDFRIATGQKTAFNLASRVQAPLFSVADHIYRFGSVRLQAKAARLLTRRAWQQLRAQVIGAAFEQLEFSARIEGVNALLRSLRERERQFRSLRDNEKAIDNDVQRVLVEIANREQDRTELENALATRQVFLSGLLGLDPSDRYRLVWTRKVDEATRAPSSQEAFDRALEHRADLHSLELQRESNDELVRTEWAGYIPRLDLGAEYSFSDADQLLEDDFFSYTLSGSVDLLDFGRHARIARFEAQAGELANRGLELERQIRFEVEVACRAVANELSRLRQARIAERASLENLRVQRSLYDEGHCTISELIAAEVALQQARISGRSARFTYFRRLAELESVTGCESAIFLD